MIRHQKNTASAALLILVLSSLLGGCVAPVQRAPARASSGQAELVEDVSGSWELKRNPDGSAPRRLSSTSPTEKRRARPPQGCPERKIVVCLFGGQEKCEFDSLGCELCTCEKPSKPEEEGFRLPAPHYSGPESARSW